MGFNLRLPKAGGTDPASSNTLPIPDASQPLSLRKAIGPALAKLQDFVEWLRLNKLAVDPNTGNVSVPNDLDVTGNVGVTGDLNVGGQSTFDTLVVTGVSSTFQQDVSVQGALDVDGAVQGESFDLEPTVQFDRHMPFGPVFDAAFWSLDLPNGVIDNNVGGTIHSGEAFVVPLRLPHGATLLGFQVDVAIPAAGTLPSSGDRVKAEIFRIGQGAARAGVLGPYASTAASLAAYQARHQIGIAPGGPSATINAEDYSYFLEITADNYATPQRTDVYFGLKVWFEATAVRPGGV